MQMYFRKISLIPPENLALHLQGQVNFLVFHIPVESIKKSPLQHVQTLQQLLQGIIPIIQSKVAIFLQYSKVVSQ